jgi:hypothetical protein
MFIKYLIAILLLSFFCSKSCIAQSAYPNYSAMRLDHTITNFMDAHTYSSMSNNKYMAPPAEDLYGPHDYPCHPELKKDLNKLSQLYNTKNLKSYKKSLNKIEKKYIDSPIEIKTESKK